MVRIKVPGGKKTSSHGLMVRYVASHENTGNALANFPSRFNLQNILLFLLSNCESLFLFGTLFQKRLSMDLLARMGKPCRTLKVVKRRQ